MEKAATEREKEKNESIKSVKIKCSFFNELNCHIQMYVRLSRISGRVMMHFRRWIRQIVEPLSFLFRTLLASIGRSWNEFAASTIYEMRRATIHAHELKFSNKFSSFKNPICCFP